MTVTTPAKYRAGNVVDSVNWNTIPDEKDLEVWNRLTANFWLPEKVPVSNDLPSWGKMTEAEQTATLRVFTGLTMLDTIQGTMGAISLLPHSATPHEEAVYTNIAFMESVHAKSYSNIFMTLSDTPSIDEAFRWSRENEWLQAKARIILDHYVEGDAQKVRVCSTFLESFLFYSGFYLPLRFAAHAKITNTADIIRLIIRDEAVHGYYVGYKHAQAMQGMSEEEKAAHYQWARDLFDKLFENEVRYTREIYDDIGWTEDVLKFLKYNANKAFMNLGWDGIFPVAETRASAEVMTSLDPSANETHDFFSGSGASYTIGTAEETEDDDWGW